MPKKQKIVGNNKFVIEGFVNGLMGKRVNQSRLLSYDNGILYSYGKKIAIVANNGCDRYIILENVSKKQKHHLKETMDKISESEFECYGVNFVEKFE